jgi:hypothetical protein
MQGGGWVGTARERKAHTDTQAGSGMQDTAILLAPIPGAVGISTRASVCVSTLTYRCPCERSCEYHAPGACGGGGGEAPRRRAPHANARPRVHAARAASESWPATTRVVAPLMIRRVIASDGASAVLAAPGGRGCGRRGASLRHPARAGPLLARAPLRRTHTQTHTHTQAPSLPAPRPCSSQAHTHTHRPLPCQLLARAPLRHSRGGESSFYG